MKFVISGFQASYQEIDEALSDPEGLNWQVSHHSGINMFTLTPRQHAVSSSLKVSFFRLFGIGGGE